MRERLIKYRVWVIVGIVAVLLVFWLLYQHQNNLKRSAEVQKTDQLFSTQQKSNGTSEKSLSKQISLPSELIIDVKGAVRNPGIYHAQASDRVIDGIKQAGGFSKKADRDKINLAQKLADEMVIYVPEKGEEMQVSAGGAPGVVSGQQGSTEMVNVNTADEQAMQNLPGIGPAKAKAIIQYRDEHGPFNSLDELTDVSGIGEKSLEKMKPNMSLQ
ncbi:helix-hairpin-helix domain-containing protein [Sporolactobacillus sp. STCC-11]|uniref:helix-hairpin-helix domain-containing protein n=1 Tax=Sporolactobacillus caesalpiniae TaxID=3230362 RepID=UPI00339516C8